MYQITGNTVSFRVTDEEKAIINSFAEKLQTEETTPFTNAKQVVFGLITKLENNVSEPITQLETVIDEELQTVLNEANTLIGYEESQGATQVIRDLLVIANTETPAVEFEKEVIKEVDKPLTENQVLLNLEPKQREVLETIARIRVVKGKDEVRNPLDLLIKRMVFNRGTLLNEHGNFFTGIRPTNIN